MHAVQAVTELLFGQFVLDSKQSVKYQKLGKDVQSFETSLTKPGEGYRNYCNCSFFVLGFQHSMVYLFLNTFFIRFP